MRISSIEVAVSESIREEEEEERKKGEKNRKRERTDEVRMYMYN